MSLVEVDDRTPNLNLRVFTRGGRHLILLWNKLKEIEGQPLSIVANAILRNDPTFTIPPDAYKLADSLPGTQIGTDGAETVICVINENKTRLDGKQKYKITVQYTGTQVSKSIIVHREGVLPPHERELPEKNIHSFLWDEKGQTWRKQNGVMGKDNRFYAGVVVMPCPNCGFDGGEHTA